MELLLALECRPFLAALGVVAVLSALQVLALLAGGSIDLDVDADVDADLDLDAGGALHWLGLGQVPLTVWLIVAAFSFGASGYAVQMIAPAWRGALLPAGIASVVAALAGLPLLRASVVILKKILPHEESEAVSRDSFVGCEGVVTVGVARRGRPAEARVRDRFGKSHYVLVEPDADEVHFATGSSVLLLRRDGEKYRVTGGAGEV